MNDPAVEALEQQEQELKDAFEKYEKRYSLPQLQFDEAPEYITMPLEQLRKKTPDELSEAVVILNRYALYIQKMSNEETSWEIWAQSMLDDAVGNLLPNISKEYGYNERPMIARTSHPVCKKLTQFLREVRMKKTRLSYIPAEIHKIADNIKDMKFIALRREKED